MTIRKFIDENKKAIRNNMIWLSLFPAFILTMIFLNSSEENTPEKIIMILIYIVSIFSFVSFGLTSYFLAWRKNRKCLYKALSAISFDKPEKLDFRKEMRFENSNFKFTQVYYIGKIGDFTVLCDIDTQLESDKIRFNFFLKDIKLGHKEFMQYSKKFNELGFTFERFMLTKKYAYKKQQFHSIEDLRNDLNGITEILKRENFEPDEIASC